MNRIAIDKFVQYLEQHKVDFELSEFPNAINLKVLGTCFAAELRAENVVKVSNFTVNNPEYIMVWGEDGDHHYGSIPNNFELLLAAYRKFCARVAN